MVAAQRGVSLVEMVVAIVVVAVGAAGVLAAFLSAVRGSADPLLVKQRYAFAEGLMEEILARPVSGDGVQPSATSSCPDQRQFDEVADYDGLVLQGICRPDGSQETISRNGETIPLQKELITTVTVEPTQQFGPDISAKKVTVTVELDANNKVSWVAYRAAE